MFHCGSPKKRKNDDAISDHIDLPTNSKRSRQNIPFSTEQKSENITRTERVREIINKEFMHEMKLKESQLDQIDDRLEEAHTMLNRLRYAIVAEYYKKQEQPQLMSEATISMQNSATVLKNDGALQIAMHPSLKKIIGKRPTNLEDIMKVCPKRAAAQNAKQGICTKTAAKRREERLQQKIRHEEGRVVDHSKIKQESSSEKFESNTSNTMPNSSRLEASNAHVLNTCRIGNKSKYFFVVGNTSKYISNADSQVFGNVSLTHKWLVYVQAKDADVPISKYIKKVRFFLHPSYRPNDIIDVHAPPFQVARRGWGEFPMRIQLFFHDKFQQKPVQLIHRVVLDTTKSGRHTLGAETVMEVWLRDESTNFSKLEKREKSSTQPKNFTCTSTVAENFTLSTTTPNKPRTISFTSIKEPFDDNFMDFLNKIDETRTSICADIEKIQPTVVVSEALEPQLDNVHRSPICKNESYSPLKRTPTQLSPYRTRAASASAKNISSLIPKAVKATNMKLQAMVNQADTAKNNLEEQKMSEVEKPQVSSSATNTSVFVSTANSPRISIIKSAKNIIVPAPSGKVFSNVSGTVILPVTKPQPTLQQKSQTNSSTLASLTANSVFQKKIVQLIDAQGKIKTVQMLVATPKTLTANVATLAASTKVATNPGIPSINVLHGNANAKPLVTNLVTAKPFVIKSSTSLVTNSTVTAAPAKITPTSNKTANANSLNNIKTSASSSSSKNVVFQKEGKLYIIDPLQMKLKQQQKNQVSLLKPQIKQQQPQSNITTISTDHDYVPAPQKSQANIQLTTKTDTAASLLRAPQLHVGNQRQHVFRTQDLLKLRKVQFEKRFYRIKFSSMRSATEYLLRRLPLNVFDKDSPAATFPFACTAPQEFRSLPPIKQRSCEWLRAKFIARLLRNLQSLQQLDANKQDMFWNTREIVTFARYFAYTPPIKSLYAAGSAVSTTTNVTPIAIPGSKEHITALIKNEVENDELQVEYDSLSPMTGMQLWLERMQQKLEQHQELLADDEIIVIDSDDNGDGHADAESNKAKPSSKDIITKRIFGSPLKFENTNSKISYLPQLARLETASQFISEISKDFSIRLQPEEIVPGIVHPVAQTLLAHILKVFVDRLLRQAIANQTRQTSEKQRSTSDISNTSLNTVDRYITSQDLRKAIVDSDELDFLTNRNFGVSNNQIKHESENFD